MNDDEFLSQFRKSPRPEFAQSLAERLSKIKGETMVSVSLNGVHPYPRQKPQRSWDWRLALVAGIVVALIGIFGLTLYRPTDPTIAPIPLYTPITKENAQQIEHLAELGKGNAAGALWSPDGKYIAVAGSLGVWMYDANDVTEPLYLIEQRNTYISAIAFSRDSSKLAFSTLDGIMIWDMASRQDVSPEIDMGTAAVSSFAFSPDASLIVMGDYQGLITIYDAATGAVKSTIEVFLQYTPIFGLDFSYDGKRIVFSSLNSPVIVLEDQSAEWENWDGEPVAFRPSESSEALTQGGAFNPASTQLAARVGNFVVIWDAITGEEIKKFDTTQPLPPVTVDGGGGGTVKGGGGDLTFSPDGQQIATVDETVRIWDLATGEGRTLLETDPTSYSIGSVNFSPDWTTLAKVGFDGVVHFIDVNSGEEVATISDYTMMAVSGLTFSPDGTKLVSADVGGMHLWNLADLADIPEPLTLAENNSTVYGGQNFTTFSPDGKTIATYSLDGDIHLLDTETGQEVFRPEVTAVWTSPEVNVRALGATGFVEYNRDGTRLVSSPPNGGVIWLWDTSTGQIIQTITLENHTLAAVAFSDDGSKVAAALGTNKFVQGQVPQISIAIYNAETGNLEKTLSGGHEQNIRSVEFSADHMHLISVDNDGKAVLWDVEIGQMVRVIQSANLVSGVAFSPDGSLIFTIEWANLTSKGMINLWDTETGEQVASFEHEEGIQVLDISADGSMIATGSVDGTIHLWGIR